MTVRFTILLTALAFLPPAFAGTIIQSQAPGGAAEMLIEGQQARINIAGQEGYLLLDLQKRKAYAVSPAQNMTLDLSDTLWGDAGSSGHVAGARLVKKGSGPAIAGYATTQYQSMAGDTLCANEYLSTEPLKIPEIREFAEVMTQFADNARHMGEQFMGQGQIDPCMQARSSLGSDYLRLGMPMKTQEADGKVSNEVTAIKSGMSIDAAHFRLPPYPVRTMGDMMKGLMQQMPSMGNMPDMKDLQGMSKEDLEKMQKQMEEALRQMQKNQP